MYFSFAFYLERYEYLNETICYIKMYAAETNGDQAKTVVEEGISDEVAQKVNIFKF